MKSVSPPFRSYVLVSRDQIARNYRNVCKVVGLKVDVAGVVKADAYGHGALEVSRVLVGEGARWLAVSSVDEGANLRCGGIRQARILVMGGFLSFEREALVEYDLTPAVHSLDQMRDLDRLAHDAGKPIPFHLKIDSGMNRLGTLAGARAILAALAEVRHARLEGLMTHFASAADYSTTQTVDQLAAFHAIRAELQQGGVQALRLHTSSTNAIGYGRVEGWHDMVRAGHALYGYVSPARGEAPPQLLDIQPALTWKARLLAVKDIPAGALVGYGGSFRAPKPMRIGILGAGYADGVFHRLSNRGKVIADGKLTPILGTISMDLTTIDLSHTTALGPGDEVTLLGVEGDTRLDAQQIARVAGTISYNILCNISARVRRVYV
ncbi:MAG TPA: alanine racemase [Bryobacteraceae bacterium]|jgi:alanine racemase|nr:alanine racemase [Bryobacteraceae bacterium]